MKRLKPQIVAALVGLYPARWKREYGDEFRDVLMRQPLEAVAVLDAVWNAMGQQVRNGEPWVIVGIPWLVLELFTQLLNVLYPGPYQADSFHNVPVAAQLIGWLLPLGIGYWTVLRDPIGGHGGRAAMKSSLLITWPTCAIAMLYGLGVLRIIVLGPGDVPTTFHEHGFAYTLYDHTRRPVAWAGLFVIPILQLPFTGAIGWLGGLAARFQARNSRRQKS
jgi:hypothetical protein